MTAMIYERTSIPERSKLDQNAAKSAFGHSRGRMRRSCSANASTTVEGSGSGNQPERRYRKARQTLLEHEEV